MKQDLKIPGIIGKCGDRSVFLGFAPAHLLYSMSFADVLDEETGLGYQRPRNLQHSVDFKKYISKSGSSTIPLTFNLRNDLQKNWEIKAGKTGSTLIVKRDAKCLAQVDCQHRLGEMEDSPVHLAFMTFIGLDLREEMAMFVTINTKAKGLSSSLTDFHQSNLLTDMVAEAPHLYIARKLNDDPNSPWFKMIKLGGKATSGLKRKTSLRMMQKAIKRFLTKTQISEKRGPDVACEIIINYWLAVAKIFVKEWSDPRHSLLTKGVGLYALMNLLSDVVLTSQKSSFSEKYFFDRLRFLRKKIEWNSSGMFAGIGGQKGVSSVYKKLRGEFNASLAS